MGTIFFIGLGVLVWGLAKSKSEESSDQQRLESLRSRLRRSGSRPLDNLGGAGGLNPEPVVKSLPLAGTRSSSEADQVGTDASSTESQPPGRWSAWLDVEPAPNSAAPDRSFPSASSAPGDSNGGAQAQPDLDWEASAAANTGEGKGQGTGQGTAETAAENTSEDRAVPTGAEEPQSHGTSTREVLSSDTDGAKQVESTGSGFDKVLPSKVEPDSGRTLASPSERPLAYVVTPAPAVEPPLSDGGEVGSDGPVLGELFQAALEQRLRAFEERGGPAPTELSISSSLVRPMGDLLSVAVQLDGGGAKHLAAQARGLPVFGLRLAKRDELTSERLEKALDHLERAHPALRRGCAERLIRALTKAREGRPSWSAQLERLVGERD